MPSNPIYSASLCCSWSALRALSNWICHPLCLPKFIISIYSGRAVITWSFMFSVALAVIVCQSAQESNYGGAASLASGKQGAISDIWRDSVLQPPGRIKTGGFFSSLLTLRTLSKTPLRYFPKLTSRLISSTAQAVFEKRCFGKRETKGSLRAFCSLAREHAGPAGFVMIPGHSGPEWDFSQHPWVAQVMSEACSEAGSMD